MFAILTADFLMVCFASFKHRTEDEKNIAAKIKQDFFFFTFCPNVYDFCLYHKIFMKKKKKTMRSNNPQKKANRKGIERKRWRKKMVL